MPDATEPGAPDLMLERASLAAISTPHWFALQTVCALVIMFCADIAIMFYRNGDILNPIKDTSESGWREVSRMTISYLYTKADRLHRNFRRLLS